ncbi:MAG: hypothetical protein KF708_00840 [Pirellulales bacterium]|nr:hypothetical protein [Pirellulales bacterium]
MANSNRPAPSPRQQRSWRAEAAPPMTPFARRSRLAFIVLAVCLLIAAMIYALYVPYEPQTHLVYTTLVEHKELTAPPWAKTFLAPEEVDTLKKQTHEPPEELKIEQAEIVSVLGSRIRGLVRDPQDRLLTMVGGQGVSRVDAQGSASKPYLLLGTFDPSDRGVGYLAVESLLAEVKNCQASVKVLVLDGGNIVCDPRIGMLANEFPRLVEAAVRATGDPSLWVILSNWNWEVSHLSYEKQRSVFSYYVSQGLQGAADRSPAGSDGERVVDLRELYDYVYYGVTNWVEKAHGASSSQHPVILRGNQGVIRRLADVEPLALINLPPVEPAPASEETQAENSGTAAHRSNDKQSAVVFLAAGMPLLVAQAESATSPAAATSETTPPAAPAAESPPVSAEAPGSATPAAPATPSSATPPTGETPGAPAAPANSPSATPAPPTSENPPAPAAEAAPGGTVTSPAAPPTPRDLALGKLIEGWTLRDRIEREARANRTQASAPADFAPHLWREHQERLLHYERMFLCGEDADYIDEKLPDNVLLLRDVAEGKPLEPRHRRSLVGRLAEQWEAYRRQPARPKYREFVVQALSVRDDALARVPYFLRWYAVASLVSPGDEPPYETLRSWIDNVAALAETLDGPRLDASRRYDETQIVELVERVTSGEAQLLAAAPRPGERTTISAVESYLSTPLPRATERAALLKWLEANDREQFYFDDLAKDFPRRTTRLDDPIGPVEGSFREPWLRMHRLAELELAAAELVDPGADLFRNDEELVRSLRTLRTEVEATLSAEQNDATAAQDAEWSYCRTVGVALENFYAQLAVQIGNLERIATQRREQENAPPDPQLVAGLERLYQLLDARDADLPIVGSLVPYLAANPDERIETEVTFDFSPSDRLILDARQSSTPLQLVTRLRLGRPGDAWVTLNYDAQLLEIRDLEGTALVNPSSRTLDDVSRRPRSFSLNGTPPLEKVMSFDVSALAEVRQRLEPGTVIPLKAALYYRDSDGSIQGPIERSIDVLPALPEVELVVDGPKNNRPRANSKASQVLQPFPNKATNYRLQIFNRGSESQEVTVKLFAVPPELARQMPKRWPLSDDGLEVPGAGRLKALATGVCSIPPGATAPVKFDQPAAATTSANGAAPAPASPASSASEPELPSIGDGLVCLLEDKLGRRSVVNLEIEVKRPADFLDVDVAWDRSRPRRVQVLVRPRGGNPAMMPPGECDVRWERRDEPVPGKAMKEAALLVPPSFDPAELFADVPVAQSAPVRVRLDVDRYPRAFGFELPIDREVSIPLRDEQRVRINWPDEEGFPIKAPTAEIPVQFQVDVPADAFKKEDAEGIDDLIEIGLVDTTDDRTPLGPTQTFHTDRQVTAHLAETKEDGTLTIQSSVRDFEVRLPAEGRRDQRVGILATFKRARQRMAQDYREIFLDATPPQVVSVGQRPAGTSGQVRVEKGNDAEVFAVVDDEGGLEKVEFFLVKTSFDVEDDWENDERLPPDSAVRGILRDNHWEATIPTTDAKGASWQLLVRATDRVGLRHKKAIPVEIFMPENPAEPGKPTAKLYDLRAVVVGDGLSNIRVRLEESGRAEQRPRANEEFSFKKLPAGDYTLTVEATVRNITQPPKQVSVTLPQEQPPERIDPSR